MTRMTKVQLIDENIRLRDQMSVLEARLASNASHAIEQITQLEDKLATAGRVQRPQHGAHRLSGELRRSMSREYFIQYPQARSVTDAELVAFCDRH